MFQPCRVKRRSRFGRNLASDVESGYLAPDRWGIGSATLRGQRLQSEFHGSLPVPLRLVGPEVVALPSPRIMQTHDPHARTAVAGGKVRWSSGFAAVFRYLRNGGILRAFAVFPIAQRKIETRRCGYNLQTIQIRKKLPCH